MRDIQVATEDSPGKRRAAWLAIGAVTMSIGLGMVAFPLAAVESLDGLAASMILVVPGLLWLATGIKVILRVTGRKADVLIGSTGVVAFTISAMVGVLGTFVMLAFWALSHSVWVNEGGTPETAPNDGLIYAGACFLYATICLLLAFASSRIEDPPVSGLRREQGSRGA
ncbi:MAG: hypothetical protein KDB54_07075 [Solirubrobacterales bacterium]|nr:hypothetical protein [Solirubrobacterales bacterium]MCB0860400.1 hypothetical protein [Solirubrobacterales bacterium]HRV60124.1 hypothetical protein [Solirubrobacterales bacterium]